MLVCAIAHEASQKERKSAACQSDSDCANNMCTKCVCPLFFCTSRPDTTRSRQISSVCSLSRYAAHQYQSQSMLLSVSAMHACCKFAQKCFASFHYEFAIIENGLSSRLLCYPQPFGMLGPRSTISEEPAAETFGMLLFQPKMHILNDVSSARSH